MKQLQIGDFKLAKFLENFAIKAPLQKVGLALLGAGKAGTIHFENLLKNHRVQLFYVVEESLGRLEQLKNTVGEQTLTKFTNNSQIEVVLKDPRVHGVIITTPTSTHFDLVIKSLKAGKAVFCEKPLAITTNEMEQCYELAKKSDIPVFCAFNRRFDPSYKILKDKVTNGEIGKIHIAKSTSREPPPTNLDYLRTSSGIFHDSAIHDIDLLMWILGEFPSKVFASGFAHCKEIGQLGDYDTVTIQLSFPSGAIACIDVSRQASYGYDQRLEVFGGGGMLQVGNQKPVGIEVYKPTGVSEAPILYSFVSRYEQSYKNELEHFINVIQGIEKPIVSGSEVSATCKVAEACKQSAATGKVVNLLFNLE